ncbi:unnamed protein product [Lampetra planeri]
MANVDLCWGNAANGHDRHPGRAPSGVARGSTRSNAVNHLEQQPGSSRETDAGAASPRSTSEPVNASLALAHDAAPGGGVAALLARRRVDVEVNTTRRVVEVNTALRVGSGTLNPCPVAPGGGGGEEEEEEAAPRATEEREEEEERENRGASRPLCRWRVGAGGRRSP